MIQTRQSRGKNGCFGKGTESIEVPDKTRCQGCGSLAGPFQQLGDQKYCNSCHKRRLNKIPPEGIDPEQIKKVKE